MCKLGYNNFISLPLRLWVQTVIAAAQTVISPNVIRVKRGEG